MEPLMYIGTRNSAEKATASEAVLKGICDDGGLFVPERFPALTEPLEKLAQKTYAELSYTILSKYLTDIDGQYLSDSIQKAYASFDSPETTPLVKKGETYFLELFHGKTLAFKDVALSLLPYLMTESARVNQRQEEIVILAATSGDTGKAALEGFADVAGTRVIVFYPEDGVSPIQKLQMVTQAGENTCVAGIKGNFDDAQRAVKEIFTDAELKKQMQNKGKRFSSANSINIGRLLPQIVYYYHAYGQLLRMGDIKAGELVNFIVPTGNFGNILAGYYAKQMGLPVGKLICASNENNVLFEFFKTKSYNANRPFHTTSSPSMDIVVSSNLERLLYHIDQNPASIAGIMQQLKQAGSYDFAPDIDAFEAAYATEQECFSSISQLFHDTGYCMDTHTAIAYACYQKYKECSKDTRKTVVLSTASPYKFSRYILAALGEPNLDDSITESLLQLSKVTQTPIPAVLNGIENRPVRHHHRCGKNDIKKLVQDYLSL